MKRFLAVAALACTAAWPAACSRSAEGPAAAEAPAAPAQSDAAFDATPQTMTAASPTEATPPLPADASAEGATPSTNAPDFAALFPDATLDAPAVTATGSSGPGGMATYTTEADPDAVIAFHRARAEAAGLSSAMAMNQGRARAYGAASPDTGANIQVVASATDAGTTSVQISWSAGR